ncbi:putative membrane protein YcfT [Microbacterium sp. W4I4]|uniref:acyltransferase family protein n=1 Tax=Microbacterium sp. W4I4 TaxID=3042295 RepID=UPI0027809E02|nr:acyltransferase family protein [Microbacterium sp. W4I4]MDQ0614359.1 putative membrane protein YcfT [Microbacterium sp. W4I4]
MSTREREGWPDVVKGVCIILVVLWHVVVKHSSHLPWSGADGIPQLWTLVSAQLLPLRMPLFFLVSGMFAAGVVLAPERTRLGERALRLGLLYVLWVVIQTFALAVAGPEFDTARATDLGGLLLNLTVSPTNLWYLLALALYLVIGRITRGVPTAVLLPVAFAISAIAAAGALPDWGNLWQVVQNVFFFLAGLRLRPQVRRLAERRPGRRTAVALAAAYVAGLVLVSLLDAREWFGVWTLLSTLAVAAGVSICALVDRWEPVAAPLRWVGQRTLPIYVIHMIPLALVDRMLRDVDGWVFSGPVLAVIEPPLVVAVVIAASLGAHALLMRAGARALFDPLVLRPVRSRTGSHAGR